MPESVSLELGGRTLTIETGELARQASGSAFVRYGDTCILAAATASANPREGIDFFPLTCDYEERMYAAGKIPGGFIKREGRPSEKATLTARLIDRPIRPLFPDGFRNDVHIICTVLSVDPEVDPDVVAMVGAGAALAVSDIPFEFNVAGVRVGIVDGEYVVNPSKSLMDSSTLDMIMAGTSDAVMMVEGGAKEISEDQFLGAVEFGHERIKEIVRVINELARRAGKPKRAFKLFVPSPSLRRFVDEVFGAEISRAMRVTGKADRQRAFDSITRDEAKRRIVGHPLEHELRPLLEDPKNQEFDKCVKAREEDELRVMVVDEGVRPDGRRLNEIRPITCRTTIVPRTHGSGLFTRGETQIFTAATLGSISDEQRIDGLGPQTFKRYMHHYNFPPYSVGETRPMRGPGRREIGHGHLAERALVPLLPPPDQFPYTLRLVSETFESNGSSSMGSVCASTLALMDAGVPLPKHVGGIAMGLILKDGRAGILSDIQGLEDALGEMDFKVAGTVDGITAVQMDIKVQGITIDVMRRAMEQARDGRIFIIGKLRETIAQPRRGLSAFAPRMYVLEINPEKIKDVIGPGGKVINKIVADTGVKIDIENDGRVFIAAPDGESGEKAKKIVEDLVRDVEVGAVYTGVVKRIMNFGAFVQILPGKEGLVHISQLAEHRVNRVEDEVNLGDTLTVKVREIDSQGRVNLSRVLTGENSHSH
ncbi:MAG TPA: polyribonucleotide nucleotidyltransferase [Candidatus Eremiobacteraceae bacterium]|nr:polyribonucleotide nucleotidyltransferase [Candidatus Eremiobacteraceae bacterium]